MHASVLTRERPWVGAILRATRLVQPRLLLVIAALALLVFAFLVARASSRQRPILDLLQQTTAGDAGQRLRARNELMAQPQTAAPVLVRLLRRVKMPWRSEVLPWLDFVPPIGRWHSHQLLLERNAIDILQRMGPAASGSVIPLLEDDRHGGRETAIALLRTYGSEICPELIDCLRHPRPAMRAGAALTLGRFPPAEQGGLGALAGASKDPEPEVRAAAVWAIGQMYEAGDLAIPLLIPALGDSSPQVKFQAVQVLRSFGADGAAAVDDLCTILRNAKDDLQAEAALTLAGIGPEARRAEEALFRVLHSRSDTAARQAAAALLNLELRQNESFDRLRALLNTSDLASRMRTVDAISNLGGRGRPLVPDLLALLENAERRDDRGTLIALREIDPSRVPERFQGRGRRRQ